jgi:hypothetical protein
MTITGPTSRRHTRAAQLLLGALVSLAFVWLAARGVDWPAAWATLVAADRTLLLLALGTVVLTTWLRAVRWRLMFHPHHRGLRLYSFFTIFLIGQVINAVIPARLGEVTRAVLIGKREGVSKAQALWTAVVEKLLDALTLLLFVAGISWYVALPEWLQTASWTLTGGIFIVLFALVGMVLMQPRAHKWLAALEERFVWSRRLRLGRLLAVVADSLRQLSSPRLFAGLMVWSILSFLAAALTNWLTARALSLPLSFGASLLLLSVLQISAVVPIPTSPGRVGLFHYLCIISLAIFGIGRDAALGYGLVLHVLVYLPMMVLGPLGMWQQSCRWSDLARSWQDPRQAEGDQITGTQ